MLPAKNNNGVVLVTVLGIIIIVSILAATALSIMSNQARLGIYQSNKIKAYHIGMSALHWAHNQRRLGNPADYTKSVTLPDGSALPPGMELEIEDDAGGNVSSRKIVITVSYSS
ncbi:MAG: hypothetical protein PHR44_04770 [Candidatus Omnitrophica bacterium]|nr:hypothetical protein [Candidatus Omnitrophota bacterium]